MTDNQGRHCKYSYSAVKSIKEFAISPGAAGPYLSFLSPWLPITPQSIQYAWDIDYLRQVSLLIGCHGLNPVFSENSYVENQSQIDDFRNWDHWKMIRSWGPSPHEWEIRFYKRCRKILVDHFYLGICPGRGPHSLYYSGTLILDF